MLFLKQTTFTFLLMFLLLFQACKKDDPENETVPLYADAGLNQEVKPMELTTLDGSNSTGPDGFTYSWSYSGDIPESDIDFKDTTTASPSFIPPKAAVYTFTLSIKSGSLSISDQVTIIASGGIEIGGTLTSDLILEDIEPNADLPDYYVISDLKVPTGITLSVAQPNVKVHFLSGTGLHVSNGGHLTNTSDTSDSGLNVIFTGDHSLGWKGIWIENSSIDMNNASIEYAGAEKFEGLDEAASLSLSGIETNLISIDGNAIKHSFEYDVYVPDQIGGEGYFKNNDLFAKNPVKAHVTFLNFYISNYPNIYATDHEYSIFVPSGREVMDKISRTFRFNDGNFLIDGDFWAGSMVAFNRCTVYMKEGSAILSEVGFNCNGFQNEPNLITGLDNAKWKGIAAMGRASQFSISNTTIANAGYGIISMKDFAAEASATVYSISSVGTIEDSDFINGGGFGYYNADTSSNYVAIRVFNNKFENLQNSAIRTNVASVSRLFYAVDASNEYNLADGIPAVTVQGDGSPTLVWQSLGEGNFYLIDANIKTTVFDGFTLNEGVHLKFRSGRYYKFNPGMASNASPLRFRGTISNPVIIEGELDEPGSWGGIYLGGADSYFQVEHCMIKNGGEFVLPGATEKANVISDFKGTFNAQLRFNNTTVSGSSGYGIVVEPDSYNLEYDAPSKNNIFETNVSGNVLVK